jgi:hypothetical protein
MNLILRTGLFVVNQTAPKCGNIPPHSDEFNLNKNRKKKNYHRFIIRPPKTKKFALNNSTKLCIEKAIKDAQSICLDESKTSIECISAWDKVEELSKAAADYQNKLISICDLQTFMFDVDPLCIDFLD